MNMVSGKQQVPVHSSFRARCEKLQSEIGKQQLEKKLADSICGCLGCCDDVECPAAIAYGSISAALKKPKQGIDQSN